MTFAPRTLLDVRAYIARNANLPLSDIGIVGSTAHKLTGTSYHLGEDDLKMSLNPYSARTTRDRNGLSNAASALDIPNHSGLVKLFMWMVAEARAGRRPDTRELIGPWDDGRAYRFDHLSGWQAELRARGDSHEWHIHESRYRDSEFRDMIRYFRGFYEGKTMGMEGLQLGDEGVSVERLQRRLWTLGYRNQVGELDGIYGPMLASGVDKFRRDRSSGEITGGNTVTAWTAEELLEAWIQKLAVPGPPGKNGVNGKDGAPGADGVDGVDGRTPTEFKITETRTAIVTKYAEE